jgi:hypothetical protein
MTPRSQPHLPMFFRLTHCIPRAHLDVFSHSPPTTLRIINLILYGHADQVYAALADPDMRGYDTTMDFAVIRTKEMFDALISQGLPPNSYRALELAANDLNGGYPLVEWMIHAGFDAYTAHIGDPPLPLLQALAREIENRRHTPVPPEGAPFHSVPLHLLIKMHETVSHALDAPQYILKGGRRSCRPRRSGRSRRKVPSRRPGCRSHRNRRTRS